MVTASAATAGTLLAHGCSSSSVTTASNPTPAVNINPADAPEVTGARLGFIALTDSAPLIIAKEKGYFQKYGMADVEVTRQSSWGEVRDNLVLGSGQGGIDGGDILSSMPYLISTGTITDGNKIPLYILARLNVNGQGISLANIYKQMDVHLDSAKLKQAVEEAKAAGPGRQLKIAVTFAGGTHDLWMRYWLAAGGINPDTDVSMFVVPPPQMVANMKTGTMHALCVGEPWNAQLIRENIGHSALITGEMWQNHPEKAFTMRSDWVDKYPKATRALLMAVQETQIWCDDIANKQEMCEIISARKFLKVPTKDIVERAKGNFDFGNGRVSENSPHRMKFWSDSASYPYKSHDVWFLTENIRWGYLPTDTDIRALVDAVNREDLWQEAAKAIGQTAAIPQSSSRGVETFFNGITFDPENPTAYLQSLKIKKV